MKMILGRLKVRKLVFLKHFSKYKLAAYTALYSINAILSRVGENLTTHHCNRVFNIFI